MIIVLPVCARDVALAVKNLEWCLSIEPSGCGHEALLSIENGTESGTLESLAGRYFTRCHVYRYSAYEGKLYWPRPQNYAWQTAVRHIYDHFTSPWFWWEADASPLRAGWARAISDAYTRCGKPFMGHVVRGMGHMNGVAVYPHNVMDHTMDAMLVYTTPFDVMLWKDIKNKTHDASHLIAHYPRNNGIVLRVDDGGVANKLVERQYAVFHGCNDGSLIDTLSGREPAPVGDAVVRRLSISDIDNEYDEAESRWQKTAVDLKKDGIPILNYNLCAEPLPSFTRQTRFESGLFPLPLNGHECHFNPSIARADGQLVLVTRRWERRRDGPWHSGLVRWSVDEQMYPSAPAEIRFPKYSGVEQYEDPRLIYNGERYCLSYCFWRHNREFKAHQSMSFFDRSWMFLATINIPYGKNGIFPGSGSGHEKNWIWFPYEKAWHFVYSATPHVVVRVHNGVAASRFETVSQAANSWQYGIIRGGTPPVRVGGEYITFFHSSLPWSGRRNRYYMGAYAFSAEPPFGITRITSRPILAGSEMDSRILGGPVVIFPGGAVFEDGSWLVVFGVNDEQCGWIKIPHGDLESLLC